MLSKVYSAEIENSTVLNFPIKGFYSAHTGNCYTFYRQGHGTSISVKDPSISKYEKITDADLGSMFLLFD